MTYSYIDCLALLGVGGAHPGGLQLTKRMLLKENIDETKTILDAGCGTGQTSAYIAEQYQCHVIALDSNAIMIDKARQRFSSRQLPIRVVQGSVENLPFDDATIDIILSESVIAFTNSALAISEFKRVLKPDGILLAIEMVLEKPLPEEEAKPIFDLYKVSQLLTESEWFNVFEQAGFQNITLNKNKQQFDEMDVENAPDFSLSENIDDALFDILKEHEHLTTFYREVLDFRIFRCSG